MKKQPMPLRPEKTCAARFDPFNSRLSRDIRNTLAECFVNALLQLDDSIYRHAAEQWLAGDLDDESTGYIHDRLKRYDRALKQIKENRIKDAKFQALIIWNHGLFFEFHEHLERIWQTTSGDEYQALKGLIQAAGVYIHLKFDHRAPAEKLAIKSANRIQKYAECLTFIGNLNLLLDKLNNLDSNPPLLSNPEIPF